MKTTARSNDAGAADLRHSSNSRRIARTIFDAAIVNGLSTLTEPVSACHAQTDHHVFDDRSVELMQMRHEVEQAIVLGKRRSYPFGVNRQAQCSDRTHDGEWLTPATRCKSGGQPENRSRQDERVKSLRKEPAEYQITNI